ncbi:hypothetical protein JTE90_015782 [Oedothorax gibbosus]|uniref:ARF7 effector protein C-terminal domain-containing protein n=1 Tax=Oedothorax gibbosus TaxID=931172 RepID=A0AAV6VXI0_9ARAC|nr:hypothetical protein JTE90_015782 [Oedothorax gibbosus]
MSLSTLRGDRTYLEEKTRQQQQREGPKRDERSRDGFDSNADRQGAKYTAEGLLKVNGADLCDCLEVDCPGCFYPCPKCSSNKCGHECRQGRKWTYDSYQIEGTDKVVTNPYKS